MPQELMSTAEFCEYHQIEYAFISGLEQSGLIHITTIEQKSFIDTSDLSALEKFIRLHYELDINLQGIEAILHLLNRMDQMQEEILLLKNKLSLYQQ